MAILFWVGFGGAFYAYAGYALVLLAWRRLWPHPVRRDGGELPTLSIVLPVFNEAGQIGARLRVLTALDYPADRLELLIVSDGSTDGSDEIVRAAAAVDQRITLVRVEERRGKGNALNVGIARALHDVVVFLDAGIELEADALRAIVRPFADPRVACVSGEDRIRGMSGEGLYGRYELFLRRCESDIHSLIGASGSFYAMRRAACPVFPEGLAPDFLSVLHTVSLGHRAVDEPAATGWMGAVEGHREEFGRKVRTLIRGMTALAAYRRLLDPRIGGAFAFFLWSHKIMRWLVPCFLVMMLVANVALLGHPLYTLIGVPHGLFYALGGLALLGYTRNAFARIAAYFINVNAAIAVAWWRFLRGQRQELWTPSRR